MAAMTKLKPEWSKSYATKPRDNLISHEHLSTSIMKQKFVPSYEKDVCPIPMSWLIGWEYARIWKRERDAFITDLEKRAKKKRIKNDYQWWLDKRSQKQKKTC